MGDAEHADPSMLMPENSTRAPCAPRPGRSADCAARAIPMNCWQATKITRRRAARSAGRPQAAPPRETRAPAGACRPASAIA
ncbi:hypothetical protein CO709_18770 [Burkholderia thailandensis]|nr:hypothetical protein CO709_18770 [Burkholderia thailandensis]